MSHPDSDGMELILRIAGLPGKWRTPWAVVEPLYWRALGVSPESPTSAPGRLRVLLKGGYAVRVWGMATGAYIVLGSLLAPNPPEELLALSTVLLADGYVELREGEP